MKRLITLFVLNVLIITAGLAQPRQKELSGLISVKGELNKSYQNIPAGTPLTILRVVERTNTSEDNGIYYAVSINGMQETIPARKADIITFATPENDLEFWQQIYLKNHLYEYFAKRDSRHNLRKEIDEECLAYLDQLEEIAYEDDYIVSYVQGVFAKLVTVNIDPNREEHMNIRVIQSPDPDAYMLPNGTMLISTGLLCTLDSEDELAAVMATEIGHFVFDHQVENVYISERRAKRAAIWGTALAITADAAFDIGYWNDDNTAIGLGAAASIGSIASLLSINTIDRLGMQYKVKQEFMSDCIAKELLTFKGYNSNGLGSALNKIKNFYVQQKHTDRIARYGSIDNIQKRLEKVGDYKELNSRLYLRKTADVVTYNASIYLAGQRYEDAALLVQKNIDNKFASDYDYVILVKSEMALRNTKEANEQCLQLLDTAQELAGNNPNLDINKQRILLLMRMNKQVKAVEELHKYIDLLTRYQKQDIEDEDIEWTDREMNWANQLLRKINRI